MKGGWNKPNEGSDHPSFMLIVRAFLATNKNRAYTTDEYKEVCLRRWEMIRNIVGTGLGDCYSTLEFLRLFGEWNDWDDRGQIFRKP